ncbi:methyltransferase [Sphingomonas morindae]|uniref:Methyltransferase n=1 Tax=Sphingomonas morindae TaxID=1541170 RepID=A0ABY4X594_9SPHN|nr:methyltransferase [Sphingomonas morindae]USI72067.1 methyltransferase [Sphingomonas morindae]
MDLALASAPRDSLTPEDAALVALLRHLEATGYAFVTPTPATHQRVVARADRAQARDLADALGWSLPFARGTLDATVEALLARAAMLAPEPDGRVRARVRVSRLGHDLFLHSAYPTLAEDAVFFGPDSYRFADLIRDELRHCPRTQGGVAVDIGAGSGVGGLVAARACPGLRLHLLDINPEALRFARINAAAAGVAAALHCGGDLAGIDGPIDIALANPPYIMDTHARAYRDGGGMHGGEVALAMARDALGRLAPEGRLILYTGSAIVRGADALREALADAAAAAGARLRYREIDPDIFGEELETPAYADVDRIALVAAIFERAG